MSTRLFISRAIATAMASSLLVLAGCGIDQSAPEGNSFVANATIKGTIMGGQQPISGSTINLYSVGTSGYGSGTIAANLLATVTTGIGGNFAFTQSSSITGPTNPVSATYGCPANNTLLYIEAVGGDPTNSGMQSNAAIKLIDALGPCSSTKTGTYIINELSTVTTLAALQQYISPINEFIGAPSTTSPTSNMSTAQTGILNAFNMVPQIYNQAAGLVNAHFAPVGDDTIITATPEVEKFNEIADIIASCVNTASASSGPCVALFSAALATPAAQANSTNYPTSYVPQLGPQDTLQATLFMLQNPTDAGVQVTTCNGASATSNLACLYSLAASNPPFVPILSSKPTDWTLGITFASAVGQQVEGQTVGILNNPNYLAIDKSGNIWVVNNPSDTTSTLGNSVTELSPYGGFIQQVLTNVPSTTTAYLGGARIPAFDPTGNLWIPNFGSLNTASTTGYGTTLVEFKPSNSTVATFNVKGGPTAVASDGAGNIYIPETSTVVSNTAGGNGTPGADVEYLPFNASANSNATALAGSATTYTGSASTQIALDSNFTLWISSGTSGGDVFAMQAPYTAAPLATTTSVTFPIGVAIDHSNNAWFTNLNGNVTEKKISSGSILDAGGPYSGNQPFVYNAMDGAGNVWICDYVNSAGAIIEYTNTGANLSGSQLLQHTFLGASSLAIDASGNVWVANLGSLSSTAATGPDGTGRGGAAAGGFVTEVLGAAVPVVTPFAAALPVSAGGTSYLATTPQ